MSVVRSVCLRLLTYYKKCKYYDEFAVFFLLKKKKTVGILLKFVMYQHVRFSPVFVIIF